MQLALKQANVDKKLFSVGRKKRGFGNDDKLKWFLSQTLSLQGNKLLLNMEK